MKIDLFEFILNSLVAVIEISPVNPSPVEYRIHGTIAATIAILFMGIVTICWNKTKFSKQIFGNIHIGRIIGVVVTIILGIIVVVCCLTIQYYFFYNV